MDCTEESPSGNVTNNVNHSIESISYVCRVMYPKEEAGNNLHSKNKP